MPAQLDRWAQSAGASPFAEAGKDGLSPLHLACDGRGRGAMAVAYRLMGAMGREAGLGLRARGTGWSPLHHAAKVGDPEVVTLLLRAGYSASDRGLEGETPLHVAAEAGNKEALKAMLKHVPRQPAAAAVAGASSGSSGG